MADSSESSLLSERLRPLRTGYIRTLTLPGQDAPTRDSIAMLLDNEIHTIIPMKLGPEDDPPPKYRWVLGAVTEADGFALDFMLERSNQRTEEELRRYEQNLEACKTYRWATDDHINRSEFQVCISRVRATTPFGRALLKRLEAEDVHVSIIDDDSDPGGISDTASSRKPSDTEIEKGDRFCDETMMDESDFLIDPISRSLCIREAGDLTDRDWEYASRVGARESSLDEVLDHSARRRHQHNGGYTWRPCCHSGKCTWRDHNYKCRLCGGKCKRNRPCEVTGEYQPEGEDFGYGSMKPIPKQLPPRGDAGWRQVTAEEAAKYFAWKKKKGIAMEKGWHSIDTFAAE